MQLDTPVVIPPTPAVVCDRMEATRINIEKVGPGEWAVGYVLNFYAEQPDGSRVYATDPATGRILEAHRSIPAAVALGSTKVPAVLNCMAAIQAAIVANERHVAAEAAARAEADRLAAEEAARAEADRAAAALAADAAQPSTAD